MDNLLTKENFKCNRFCGECCKKTFVILSNEDIKRIKNLGHKEDDFLEEDIFRKRRSILKKAKDGCVFLEKDKNGMYSCKIHNDRPDACKKYPFFTGNEKIKSCLPQDLHPNVFFSFNKKE